MYGSHTRNRPPNALTTCSMLPSSRSIITSRLVNALSAKADSFSGKLCGNPLAWRLKAGSRPKIRPHEHDARRRHVAVSMMPTIAGMLPLG